MKSNSQIFCTYIGLNRNFLKDQTETALSESVGPTSTGLENTHPEAQQQRISNVDNVYEIPNHGRQQASHSKPNESQTRCIDAIDSSSYISRVKTGVININRTISYLHTCKLNILATFLCCHIKILMSLLNFAACCKQHVH